VVGKFESRVKLDNRHVTGDAAPVFALVCVMEGMTGDAFLVIEFGLVAFGVLVRGVASGASEFAGGDETAALFETEGLEADVLELCVVNRRSEAVADTADFQLLRGG
jgi:hypothetical protein